MKTNLPSTNRADPCTIQRNPFFVSFSAEHKGIWGDIWTSISTYSSIRQIWWNLCCLDDDYFWQITSNLKIRPIVSNLYKPMNSPVMFLFAARLARISVSSGLHIWLIRLIIFWTWRFYTKIKITIKVKKIFIKEIKYVIFLILTTFPTWKIYFPLHRVFHNDVTTLMAF